MNFLIDTSYLAYRNTKLSWLSQNDTSTGIIYGVLRSYFKLQKLYLKHKFYFALDSYSWRKNVYSDYKGKRDKPEGSKTLYHDIGILLAILQCFPIKICYCDNYEADDVIASFTSMNQDNIIYTSDKDYYQLLNNNTVIVYIQF